jgi:hypothetical protein
LKIENLWNHPRRIFLDTEIKIFKKPGFLRIFGKIFESRNLVFDSKMRFVVKNAQVFSNKARKFDKIGVKILNFLHFFLMDLESFT